MHGRPYSSLSSLALLNKVQHESLVGFFLFQGLAGVCRVSGSKACPARSPPCAIPVFWVWTYAMRMRLMTRGVLRAHHCQMAHTWVTQHEEVIQSMMDSAVATVLKWLVFVWLSTT